MVPHRIIWSWYTGRWWVGCYIWYSEDVTGRNRSPPRPLLAVPNVTAHPSTASVPITILLHNGPLLCGFNVAIKGLMWIFSTLVLFSTFTRYRTFNLRTHLRWNGKSIMNIHIIYSLLKLCLHYICIPCSLSQFNESAKLLVVIL